MKIDINKVPMVILGFRWAMLALALLCILVFDLPNVGLAIAVFVLTFGLAMRFEKVRFWVIGWLTGYGAAVIRDMRDQYNAATAKQGQTSAQSAPLPMPQTQTESPMQDQSELDSIVARERQEAVLLKRHWPPMTPAPQNSWLGGLPTLPDGLDWPIDAKTGFALHHLAQIDLAEMPRLSGQADLPQNGMLWFFADIGEDMDWMGGEDQQYSRVLYHPESTKGLPERAAPATLPYVDHRYGSLDPNPIGFRAPPKKVYPKWPVSGHVSGAWEFSDTRPEGVVDHIGYSTAQEAAKTAERAQILGPKVEDIDDVPHVIITRKEDRTRPDGTSMTVRSTEYDPTNLGGHFPYVTRLGVHVLEWMSHKMSYDLSSAQRSADLAQSRGGEPRPFDAQRIEAITPMLDRITALLAQLDGLDAQAPLGAQAQTEFDAVLTACLDAPAVKSYVSEAISGGVIALVAEGITQPDLLADVPDPLIQRLHRTVLPSHHYTHHYFLGPKGGETNPTAGYGIRLAQFDSDYALGFMFCDCGVVDFWISEEDLAAGRWDKAWAGTAGG